MITTISLQWASDFIEQTYIFSRFDDIKKVVPIQFAFEDQTTWEDFIDPKDQIFVGLINSLLSSEVGLGTFGDQFADFDNNVLLKSAYNTVSFGADTAKMIRENFPLVVSNYKASANKFTVQNIAVGYIFNLIV